MEKFNFGYLCGSYMYKSFHLSPLINLFRKKMITDYNIGVLTGRRREDAGDNARDDAKDDVGDLTEW
jgi:hypothetical protein